MGSSLLAVASEAHHAGATVNPPSMAASVIGPRPLSGATTASTRKLIVSVVTSLTVQAPETMDSRWPATRVYWPTSAGQDGVAAAAPRPDALSVSVPVPDVVASHVERPVPLKMTDPAYCAGARLTTAIAEASSTEKLVAEQAVPIGAGAGA